MGKGVLFPADLRRLPRRFRRFFPGRCLKTSEHAPSKKSAQSAG